MASANCSQQYAISSVLCVCWLKLSISRSHERQSVVAAAGEGTRSIFGSSGSIYPHASTQSLNALLYSTPAIGQLRNCEEHITLHEYHRPPLACHCCLACTLPLPTFVLDTQEANFSRRPVNYLTYPSRSGAFLVSRSLPVWSEGKGMMASRHLPRHH